MAEERKPEEQDDDILNILQKFGNYQLFQYFIICLPTVFSAMNNVNYVFVAGDIDYRCRIPECESNDIVYEAPWWPAKVDRCSEPIVNYTDLVSNQCTNNSFTSTVTECKDWVYSSNDTIVAWLNLACDPWKLNFVGTIHSIGMILGMTIGGWSLDKFGRKPTLTIASIGIVIGTLKTFMSSYYAYIFIELMEASLCGGAFAAGLVLITEISGNDKRILSGVLISYAIYTGEALLVGVALLFPYWKTIIYVTCSPAMLFILYTILLNESPQWQVLNNKLVEARKVLQHIVKLNKINVSPQAVNNTDSKTLRQICNIEDNTHKEGYKEIFASKEIVKITCVVIIIRFAATLIYYGLVVNSVWLPGDKYMNYFFGAIMSFFGDIFVLYFMNKFGRKWPLICGYIISGVACLAYAYVPDSLLWIKLLFYVIAKLMITACYTGQFTYCMELFPTSVRGTLYGFCNLTASAGWIMAPMTPAMATISPAFVPVLFFCSAISASLALTLTHETKDRPLVGTITELVTLLETMKNVKTKEKMVDNGDFEEDNQ